MRAVLEGLVRIKVIRYSRATKARKENEAYGLTEGLIQAGRLSALAFCIIKARSRTTTTRGAAVK